MEKRAIKLTLPYPPSVNSMLNYNRGIVFLSNRVVSYKAEVSLLCRGKVEIFDNTKTLALTMIIYRPRRTGDLDNRIKVVLDALNGIAFVDDRQIAEIHAFRFDDKANPRCEIDIREINRD